ncbi:HET-domain-containing protein [Cadophora sp. DSE1049]|nr:HET-domain-containing protein [Cadophora sp. DSE1049]
MRLINTKTLGIESFPRFEHPTIPAYAILSHRWGADEVSLQEMQDPSPSLPSKLGYQKVLKCCEVAGSFGFEYIWIDTCCIDKTNKVELTEAINSMFNYYRDADVCYAYLVDVPSDDQLEAEESRFRKSSWFTRGWTLQELLGPETVIFYGNDWKEIGTKSSLPEIISGITSISLEA